MLPSTITLRTHAVFQLQVRSAAGLPPFCVATDAGEHSLQAEWELRLAAQLRAQSGRRSEREAIAAAGWQDAAPSPSRWAAHAATLPAACFSPSVVRRVGRYILEAIGPLHSCRAVHTRVSPRRVVRFFDGTWRLVGLRHARAFGSPLERDDIEPRYCAPEVAKAVLSRDSIALADGRLDVWALGALLFELIAGRCVPHDLA